MRPLLLLLLISAIVSAERFQDADSSAAALWKNLLESGDLPSLMSERDLRFILEHAPAIGLSAAPRQAASAGGAEAGKAAAPAGFPELTAQQRKFAVNPGLKSYYDPRFRKSEGIGEEDASVNTDEIATDPFSSSNEGKHQSPKKASTYSMISSTSSEQVDLARINDIYFTTIVAVSSALAVFAIVGAGFCYHRVRRNSKASEDVEYPAYGVTGPGKETSPTAGGDRKLAQNAQMYHYQHQKQQMIAFDSANSGSDRRNGPSVSDCESDDGEEGDYTVYECPGLAPAGEMEVRNPLFQDDPTPKSK